MPGTAESQLATKSVVQTGRLFRRGRCGRRIGWKRPQPLAAAFAQKGLPGKLLRGDISRIVGLAAGIGLQLAIMPHLHRPRFDGRP